MHKNFIIGISHLIFILHIGVILIIFFGSFIPEIRLVYQVTLLFTIMSWLSSTGCFLTIWEYKLRKKINSKLEIYEYGFIDYYLRKYFIGTARPKFVYRIGMFFLVVSLFINIVFYEFIPFSYL